MRWLVVLVAMAVVFSVVPALGDIPQTMSYQGVLKDSLGNTVPDGTYEVAFALYWQFGGSAVWSEVQTLPVSDGILNAVLGSVNPLDVAFDVPYWLDITVDGVHLEPRVELTSAPYALRAAVADSLTGSATFSDGDWEISGPDVYRLTGEVGIGTSSPAGRLDIRQDGTGYALYIKHDSATADRTVNIERTTVPESGRDLLQMRVPSYSPDDFQFIECERAGGQEKVFVVDGDGKIYGEGGLEIWHDVTPATTALTGIGAYICGSRYGVWADGYAQSDPAARVVGVTGWAGGVEASDECIGVRGLSVGSNAATNYGIYGTADYGTTNYAGYFEGDVEVTGTLSKTAGGFKIDHPLDPAGRYLSHSTVESPDMKNVYDGVVVLDGAGEAWVELPEWFDVLNRDFRYQLTAIGEPGPDLYIANEISGNGFSIAGGSPGMKVSWQVTGIRQDGAADAYRIAVESEKPAHQAGKYLNPEVYGQPESMGVHYVEMEEPDRSPREPRRRATSDSDSE